MRAGTRLEIRGGGSKAAIGAPRDATILSTTGLVGVIDYDPAELVLTVRAGTPLAEVEALVASERQMLAFEPWDHGPLFGVEAATPRCSRCGARSSKPAIGRASCRERVCQYV